MIQKTKSLRKIAALKKRIWVIQGGQGAAKTFSILILIANHAKANANKEIFIASQELTKMRITVIKDFVKIMKDIGIFNPDHFIAETLYRFPNGSFIKFIGLDKEDLGKGLRSDLVFVNEANKVSFETYRELTSRAKRVIIDFNPNGEFWAHTEILPRPDAEFLTLTYEDNEYLSIEERTEILMYKTQAYFNPNLPNYDIESNIKNKYWRNKWHIYGLGKIGSAPNRILFWEEIPDDQYYAISTEKYYGVDWGTVDPWGILEAKYYDGGLYFHELNYRSENQIKEHLKPEQLEEIYAKNEGLVTWLFGQLGIEKKKNIICDNNRPLKITALWDSGYDYATAAPKPPGSIIDGLNGLSEIKCYYTKSSANLKNEQENYQRKVDRYGIVLEEPVDALNHLIDPSRYIYLWLVMNGIIKPK